MRSQPKILCLFLFFLIAGTVKGQTGTEHYYINQKGGEIRTTHLKGVKNRVELYPQNKALWSIAGAILPEVLKFGLNKLSGLVYNPQNYLAEFEAKTVLYTMNSEKVDFGSLGGFSFVKSFGDASNKEQDNEALRFNFLLSHEPVGEVLYTGIELDSATINYSQVKLKKGGKNKAKVNYIIDLDIVYFDKEGGERHTRKIDGFKLLHQKPGVTSPPKMSSQMQVVSFPKLQFVESIEIKVSEVNAHKKHWDELMEHYNNNQEKVQETLLSLIKTD